MKTVLLRLFAILSTVAFLSLASCVKQEFPGPGDGDNTEQPEGDGINGGQDVKPDDGSGISFEPAELNADQPCTIMFKPSASSKVSSALYNCTGDIYVHIGVYYDEEWKFVQAEWNENKDKCRMEKVGDNSYKLVIGPTMREFFASGTTPLETMALVFRNADGTKQTKPDQFISVTDDKYKTEVFVPDAVQKAAIPAGAIDGINYNIPSKGDVTLVLHDKAKDGSCYEYAYVIGEFSAWKRVKEYAMKRDDSIGSWWCTLSGMDPDKEYMFQYHVGNGQNAFRIHDAYSEIVYDPWNDKYIPSSTYPDMPAYPDMTKDRVGAFKINRDSYDWEVKDFRIKDENSIVIYEMLFRDFTSTHDINGATARLDYLQNLGVNALELMPIQEFEGNDSWGYNPCSYFALDKAYGTRLMYKKFIDECHKRGMAVIVDVVYNHTTGAHPFARLYWNGSDNVLPINPCYNVVTPHGFGVFQDINHMDPMMSEHIKRSLVYLLDEYKVDGFRFDLTKGFTNNSGKDSSYDQQRVDILKGYNDAIKAANPDAMVILEHFVDAENTALGDAGMHVWGNCNNQYTSVVKGTNADLSYIYDPKCCRVGYMESHDEERICYGETASVTSVNWGIVGTMTGWGDNTDPKYSKDIVMTASGNGFVAKGVRIAADDAFKIRGNNSWDDNFNYGADLKYTRLPLNTAYTLTLGSSSQDMKAPAAGTYDIWFSPDHKKVWLMEQGKTPEIPAGSSEDPFSVKMRRAGLAAAFFLTVPGPKMIWQFGELGYDYSIMYGGENTTAKPIKWEFLDDAARKSLHDTYAGLLEFRNAYPAFFTKGASFRQNVGTSAFANGKFIFGEADGKAFCVMGNFDSSEKEITAQLPSDGTWYNWFDKSETRSGDKYTVRLKPGEFRLITNFK